MGRAREEKMRLDESNMFSTGPVSPLSTIPDVDGGFLDILKATGTVTVGAQALLGGRHEVLQVLGEILVLVPEQVDLHRCLMDL